MHRIPALEHLDPCLLQHGDQLVALVRVEVVVPEDGIDRQLERAARVGEHGRLLRLAVRGQVAGEQDDVGVALQVGERARDPLAQRLGAVDVSGGGNTNRLRHRAACSRSAAFTNGNAGIAAGHGLHPERELSRADRGDEARGRHAPRRRRPVHARRRARSLGPRRAADRARRRLLRPAGRCRAGARCARGGRAEARAAAGGLAPEGLGRRDSARPDLQPDGRRRRRRLLRALRGDRGGGAAAAGRLTRRRPLDEAAGAERAGPGSLFRARARPLAPGADRLGLRPRPHRRVPFRTRVLHARRGARRRRAAGRGLAAPRPHGSGSRARARRSSR